MEKYYTSGNIELILISLFFFLLLAMLILVVGLWFTKRFDKGRVKDKRKKE